MRSPGPVRRWRRRRSGSSRDGSHVHPRTLRRDRHPAMPLHHRHDYAAALHRGLPVRRHHPAGKFPANLSQQVRGATQPMSARFRVGGFVLRSVQPLVPPVCLSVSLAEPALSGSPGTARRCRGLLHRPPPRRGSRPSSSFQTPAATGIPRWPPTIARVRERLVALDVGQPQPVRCRGGEVASTRSSWAGGPGCLPLRRRFCAEQLHHRLAAQIRHTVRSQPSGRRGGPHRPAAGSRTPGHRRGRRTTRWPDRPRSSSRSPTGQASQR